MKKAVLLIFIGAAFAGGGAVAAEEDVATIPAEYETGGGPAQAFGDGGMVATGGLPAIRLNPAMMPLEPVYLMTLGWNWPERGRPFYQAGIVDSRTSDIAAGVSFTGFTDAYNKFPDRDEDGFDAPLEKRMVAAVAKAFRRISIGVNGDYVVGYRQSGEGYRTVKGLAYGFGLAGLLTKRFRIGLSAENLGNRKIRDFAPETWRAGVAWIAADSNVTLHLDYRQRQRVPGFEQAKEQRSLTLTSGALLTGSLDDPEQMMIGSFSARVYGVIRLLGGYGYSLSDEERQSLSGGIGLIHNRFNLVWSGAKPWLRREQVRTSLTLSMLTSL